MPAAYHVPLPPLRRRPPPPPGYLSKAWIAQLDPQATLMGVTRGMRPLAVLRYRSIPHLCIAIGGSASAPTVVPLEQEWVDLAGRRHRAPVLRRRV